MFGFLRRLFQSSSGVPLPNRSGDAETEWYSWKPGDGPPDAPEGFVKLSGATEVSVAGTSYRLDDCNVFFSALKGKSADKNSIRLVRDTSIPDHPAAIAVFGVLGHREIHLGYLPSHISDLIKSKFSVHMPLRAGLKEWGKKKTGDAIYFRIVVFVPNAKERKNFDKG